MSFLLQALAQAARVRLTSSAPGAAGTGAGLAAAGAGATAAEVWAAAPGVVETTEAVAALAAGAAAGTCGFTFGRAEVLIRSRIRASLFCVAALAESSCS